MGLDARAVRAALTNAHQLCAALGLLVGHQRQAGGVVIRCPNPQHSDRTPSCSVRLGPDGTIAARCFSCEWSGDALTLVAIARGLDLQIDFPDVVEAAADIAGGAVVAGEAPARPIVVAPPSYPAASEVEALWSAGLPLERARRLTTTDDQIDVDPEAHAYLRRRAIDPGTVDLYDLMRVLPPGLPCPAWANVKGRPWSEAGYRLVIPMVDHEGKVRSLRAWRLPSDVIDAPGAPWPKRVAPSGRSTLGLVMADPIARQMLQTGRTPSTFDGHPLDVVICEGEPDFLTNVTYVSDACDTPPAVLGVVSAAWSQAIADRIPEGSNVYIRTHRDQAGDRYAQAIKESLHERLVALFDFDRRAKRRHGETA